MSESFIIYSLGLGMIGLLVAALLSLSKTAFKPASWLFVLSNAANFIAGCVYLFSMAGKTVTFGSYGWFFQFAPTLGFLSAIFLTVVSGVSLLVGIYSVRYLEMYKETYDPYSTQFLMSLFVFGMQAVLLANNVFAFLFFWEVMSLSSFFLVLADKTKESFSAAFIYFIMTHLGASAILGGFLLLGKGSLMFELSAINAASQNLSPSMLAISFGLLLFGFGSKAGLVPFHIWLPEAHPQAPSSISALMSGLMLKVALYGFLLVALNFATLPLWASYVLIGFGLLSGFVGALYAALESDMKKALAYSSIENIGIIFSILGLSLFFSSNLRGTSTASYATPLVVFALIHAASHAFFKTALFLSSGVVISRVHSRSLEVMGGFAKALPLFSGVFLIAILGSLPLPPFGTFYGEWGLIHVIVSLLQGAALQPGLLPILILFLSAIGLIGGLALFAMIKLFAISMLGQPRSTHHAIKPEKGDNFLIIPIGILAAAVAAVGLFAQPLVARLNYFLDSGNGPSGVVGGQLSSYALFIFALAALLFAYLFNLVFARNKTERPYHTWDCGQPINATMEYTSTAFVAPIRFFFINLIRRTRVLASEPVVSTNAWIRKYSYAISIHPAMKETLYRPVSKLVFAWAERAKVVQSGRIQYYILLLLVTLIIALSIAL